MKKTTALLLTLLAVAMFVCVFALPLASAAEKGTWTGWITDSSCGAKGAKAEHRDCALKCLNDGGTLVFYETGNHKIYKIENQEQAKQHLGHEVVVTGEVADGTYILIDSITSSGK
jgi:hypothetical protein